MVGTHACLNHRILSACVMWTRRPVQHHHVADRRRADRILHLLADHLQHARWRAHAHPRLDHRMRGPSPFSQFIFSGVMKGKEKP